MSQRWYLCYFIRQDLQDLQDFLLAVFNFQKKFKTPNPLRRGKGDNLCRFGLRHQRFFSHKHGFLCRRRCIFLSFFRKGRNLSCQSCWSCLKTYFRPFSLFSAFRSFIAYGVLRKVLRKVVRFLTLRKRPIPVCFGYPIFTLEI